QQGGTRRPPASGQQRTSRPGSIPPKSGQHRTASGQHRTTSGQQRTTSGQHRTTDQVPRWKYWLRRIGLGALIAGLAVAVIGTVGLLIRYATLQTPTPANFALYESSTIYFADGVTPIGTLGEADRTIVDIDTLPDHVPNAFVAAEDRTFYDNPGVDV